MCLSALCLKHNNWYPFKLDLTCVVNKAKKNTLLIMSYKLALQIKFQTGKPSAEMVNGTILGFMKS